MAHLLALHPRGSQPERLARLVWTASTQLLEAARAGRREAAARMGWWLTATRAEADCPQALRRTIDRSLAVAQRHLGGTLPDFQPIQPDDGEAA